MSTLVPKMRSRQPICFAFLFSSLVIFRSVAIVSSNHGGNESDHQALVSFKSMITHDPYGSLSTWNTSLHFCEWSGVSCGKRHRRVIGVQLNSQGLEGILSPHVGNISFLREFSIRDNYFQGTIPPELGRLSRLRFLGLDRNKFDGVIPANLSGCFNLEILWLASNKLVGRIPKEISSLSKLTFVVADKNNLTGGIPPFLGNMTSMEVFSVSGNPLGGSIPDTLGHLKSLREIFIGRCMLYGTIPHSFYNLSLLANLSLAENRLIGSLPIDIGALFPHLVVLQLRNNQLTGPLPPSISYRSSTKEGFLKVSYGQLLKATDGFSEANLIGKGGFSSVYKGILDRENRFVVAVKVLHLQNRGAHKSFITECKAWQSIRHRNLLKIITICSSVDFQGNDFKALVYEFMPNGSLDEWLHPSASISRLNLLQRINILIDVASALSYLHNQCLTTVVHGDLKPSNILLDEDMVAHVGDFGLARFLGPDSNTNSSTRIRGTFGYVAPEYGLGGEMTSSGDVYSFGILLLEVMTRKRPTDNIFNGGLSLHKFASMAFPDHLSDVIDSEILEYHQEADATYMRRMEANAKTTEECLASIVTIGVSCSVDSPSQRMNIETVVHELKHILGMLQAKS